MLRSLSLLVAAAGMAFAQASPPPGGSDVYRLYPRDLIKFGVYGENDLSTSVRIAGNGNISVPLLGEIKVAGLSLSESEKLIQEKYISEQILIRPQVSIQVQEYSKKEILILGQAGRQGKIELPAESSSLSIVEAITAAGGFSRIGKGDSVRVTRKNPETGVEEVFVVDAERLISGKGGNEMFYVLPGDVIFVPERLF
jgi:polysaccharide export outer membrane protein